MKKTKKKLMLGMAALLCASLSFTSAASAATSVYGQVAGYSTSGYLSMGSSSATASTTCSTVAGVSAYVAYTYYYNNFQTETVTNNTSLGSTSVSTTASAKWVSVQSRYATGSHSVTYQTQYWSAGTSTQ
ncbi:hypothetical protein [Paenibacillus sp. GCM10027626]|uniref:hypothetical protein n=1 Tax=Paenibacillus sp. GCM10027626 TaxID=3273411 RepID=UPI003640E26A